MANTLSEFFEKEWSAVSAGRVKSGEQKPKKQLQPLNTNRFANKKIESFSRICCLLQNEQTDVYSQNEQINLHIKECQRKRSLENADVNEREKRLCGIVIKVGISIADVINSPSPTCPYHLKS